MSSYDNDLRLEEIVTGAQSGTWGDTTNVNLKLIAEAFSYGTEAISGTTHNTTIANGVSDPGRSMYLKYTGSLSSACTISLLPNTVSKVWIIENATSGSQNIIISQGSGANITISNGSTKVIYTDGAGSGAAVYDAFANLALGSTSVGGTGLTVSPTLTVGTGAEEDTKIVFDGNAQDFYIGLDDSADDLIIGKGSAVGTTPAISIDENLNTVLAGNVTITGDATITGDDITMATNTAGHILVADGTNYNPVAMSGHVSIASNGATTISTSADVQVDSIGIGTAASGTTGEIRATNNITAYYSDERLKDFEGTIPNALDKVSQIGGYYFRENETAKKLGYDNDELQVGVNAQEIQKVMPEVVKEAPVSSEYLTVQYEKLVPLLIESIKELKQEIEELKWQHK